MKKKSLITSILVIVLFYIMGCDNSQNEDFENNFQSRPMINGSLLFDGKENAIVEENKFSDILYKNMSLEIVFNQGDETDGNYQCLFYCKQRYVNSQSSGDGFYGFILNHKFYFVYFDDNHFNYITTKPIMKGDCNHISIVKNVDIVKLFLNGELVNTKRFILGDERLDLQGAPFIFGSDDYDDLYGFRGFYHGTIDEFRFWDYNLSSEDVLHGLFREINSGNEHLIAHYKFQNNGQVVKDYSFNHNDGFLGVNVSDTELDPERVGNICME